MLASRNSPNCKPDCHLTTTPQVPSTHVDTPAATCAELGGRRNTTCTPSNARALHARCSGRPCTYNDNLSQRPHTQTHQIILTSGTMSRQNIRWGTANMHASCTACQHRAPPSAPAQRQCAGKEIILFGLKVTAASTPHREDPIIGIHRWYKLYMPHFAGGAASAYAVLVRGYHFLSPRQHTMLTTAMPATERVSTAQQAANVSQLAISNALCWPSTRATSSHTQPAVDGADGLRLTQLKNPPPSTVRLTCHPQAGANEDGAGASLDCRHDQRGAATEDRHTQVVTFQKSTAAAAGDARVRQE